MSENTRAVPGCTDPERGAAALRKTRPGHLDVPRWVAPAGAIAAALPVYASYLGFVGLPAAGRVGSLNGEVVGLKMSVQELNVFRDASRRSHEPERPVRLLHRATRDRGVLGTSRRISVARPCRVTRCC